MFPPDAPVSVTGPTSVGAPEPPAVTHYTSGLDPAVERKIIKYLDDTDVDPFDHAYVLYEKIKEVFPELTDDDFDEIQYKREHM